MTSPTPEAWPTPAHLGLAPTKSLSSTFPIPAAHPRILDRSAFLRPGLLQNRTTSKRCHALLAKGLENQRRPLAVLLRHVASPLRFAPTSAPGSRRRLG